MAEVISPNALEGMIEDFNKCTLDFSGFGIPGIDLPGLGSMMAAFIRVIEAGVTAAFEPFLKMIELVKDIPNLVQNLANLIASLADIISDPIGFIVGKLLEPLEKLLAIPIPSPAAFIQMLIAGIPLPEIDWSLSVNVLIPPKFQKLAEETQELILRAIAETKEFFPKLVNFLLFPIKVAMGFFKKFIEMLVEALDVTKIIQFVIDMANPVKKVLEMMGEVFAGVVTAVLSAIPDIDISAIEEEIKEAVVGFFTGIIDKAKLKLLLRTPILEKAAGIIGMVICLAEWLIGFIGQIPALLLS